MAIPHQFSNSEQSGHPCRIAWQRAIAHLLCLSLIALSLQGLFATPAAAAIRTLEEGPGQIVYQTRSTLVDDRGNAWQEIVFRRDRRGQLDPLRLRLVGFPGQAAIAHSAPLTLSDGLGTVITAPDDTDAVFAELDTPEPHIAQYDLSTAIKQIPIAVPLTLHIPSATADPIVLHVTPSILQAWGEVNAIAAAAVD
mgnify:CR=1 FL=1